MPYIERDFPIELIDKIARSESNARKPIYHIHKWFARRVGSTFRALLLGTFLNDDPMSHYYEKKDLENSNGKAPVVLDPFMGGGTTIVEGARLGCKMIGIDINPVAWFITKKELDPVEIEKVENEFERIEKTVKDKILSYYETSCKKGHEADVMYVFWVKKVTCENCGEYAHLYKSFIIAKPKEWVYQCPNCGEVFRDDADRKPALCPACLHSFPPDRGFATGKTYTCQQCGFEGDILSAVQKEGGPPELEIFAIEYYCSICGRGYKKADENDMKLFNRAKEEFERKKDELLGRLIPNQEIPDAVETHRLHRYKIRYWYQMFNQRQLLSLSMLLQEILEIEDQKIREFFLITFSDMLNANNMFTIYNMQALKIEPLFGGHHFWPPASPIEGNLWGAKYGRGTFVNYFRKGLKAIDYMLKPYEMAFDVKNGKRLKLKIPNDKVKGDFAQDLSGLNSNNNVLLKCNTGEDLSFIPDESVDAVITDPPYYDNIMYSELSDFFYVWLRLGLKDIYPEIFGSPLTRKDREIVVNNAQGKDEEFFIEAMTRVFKQCCRVLKSSGIMAFVFQHKRTEAWSAVLRALLKSGFYVKAVYPTHGETRSGVRAYGINYNSILVCKKLLSRKEQQLPWVIFESELRGKVDTEIEEILDRHPELEIEDAFIIAMGKALEVYSQNCGNVSRDGQIFDVSEVSMGIIGDVVFDSVLRHVLARVPDVDRISKIYASVFVKKEKITNDTVNKLARHGGMETNVFGEEMLVKKNKKKGVMRVTPPEERKEFIQKKIEKGLPLKYIDGAHLLSIAREGNEGLKRALNVALRTGLDRNKLGQYISFLAKRTDNLRWKKLANTLLHEPELF